MDENTPPPVPPAPAPEPKPAESAPPPISDESSGVAPNIAAGICAVLPLVGGIIFLVLEKKNAFVRFWAMQSVFFGGLMVGISIVLSIASFIFAHIPILGWIILLLLWIASIGLWLGSLIVWVVTIIKAFSNVEWEIPYLGKLARKQLAGQPVV